MQGALIVFKIQSNNFTYLEMNSTYLEWIQPISNVFLPRWNEI